MTMLPILASLVASSQKFSSVTSSRLFILNWRADIWATSFFCLKLSYQMVYFGTMELSIVFERNKSMGQIEMAMVFDNCTQPLLGNTIHCIIQMKYHTTQCLSDLNSHANVNKVVSNLVLVPDNVGLANSFKNLPNLLLKSLWTPCVEKLK